MKKKKTILLLTFILVITILISGITFAVYTYNRIGGEQKLVLGDIYIHYRETDKFINISNAMPQKLIADDFTKEVLNPVMQTQSLMEINELDACVNYFYYLLTTNVGDVEYLCKGGELPDSDGMTLADLINQMGLGVSEYLNDNNIIVQDGETYKLNSIMENQNLSENMNELTTCNSHFDSLVSLLEDFGDSILLEGESPELFCKGGTIGGAAYSESGDLSSMLPIDVRKKITLDTLLDVDLPYFEFTIDGKNTYTDKDIEYEIVLNNSEYEGADKATRTERITDHFLKFALVEIIDEKAMIVFHNVSYEDLTDTTIFTDSISSNDGEIDRTYRLYMWIGDEVVIGGGEAQYDYDMETWNNKIYASVRVDVNANFTEKNLTEEYTPATDVASFKRLLNNEFQDNVIVDTDGTMYLSGTNDQINYNYIWYSGKLWRITSINPDGSMKLITQDNITAINWGEKATISNTDLTSAYATSWVREWLNQEFLPTLYNYKNIIVIDSEWDATTNEGDVSIKPNGTTLVRDAVGLLNSYEDYKSYQKLGISSGGFLVNEYNWWLITPYSASGVREGVSVSILGNDNPATSGRGIRPSINLKSTIKFSDGTGTIDDPYIIEGTEEDIIVNSTLLNTRLSGEYVKLENDKTEQIFRIVDTEIVNNKLTTKLTTIDYVKDTNDEDSDGDTIEVLIKYFSSSNSYELWSEVDKTDTTYWRGYLNNTWIKEIDNTYNETTGTSSILEKGTYYLGYYPGGVSYKQTVCSTVDSNVSIKECIETGNVVSNKVTDDYVGLLRSGEIFASQIGSGLQASGIMWFITPYDTNSVRNIIQCNGLGTSNPYSNEENVRPTINLKSEIVIKSGSGTEQDPFIVGLPS